MKYLTEAKIAMTFAITTLTVTALALPATAQGDNKVYAGSNCLAANPDSVANLSRTGGIFTSRNPSGVVCPIVRDNTSGGNPSAFIFVSGNLSVDSCVLNTYRQDGSLRARTQDSDGQLERIGNLRKFDIRNAPQVSQGAYEIRCDLPAQFNL